MKNKTIEEKLKELIIARYGTMLAFSSAINIPNSTLAAILIRGVDKASINNIIKICNELNISTDALAEGKIVQVEEKPSTDWKDLKEIITFVRLALSSSAGLTLDGEPLTYEDIEDFIEHLNLSCEFIVRKHRRNV